MHKSVFLTLRYTALASVFEGRDVVVADIKGTFNFGEKEWPLRGFKLLDIATGATILSQMVATYEGSIKGKMIKIDIFSSEQTNLPPKPSELQASGDQGVRQRLEKIKRFLEEGLITPDEAATKRKEILNSL